MPLEEDLELFGDLEAGEPTLEEQVQEVSPVKAKRAPNQPTAQEVEEHNKTHCPFQSCCRYCVIGRATNARHRYHIPGDDKATIPCLAMDYGFMSKADKDASNTITLSAWFFRGGGGGLFRERRASML